MKNQKYDLEQRLMEFAARIIKVAESSRDFIHKIRIALKELRETSRWLKLIKYIKLLNKSERLDGLIDETEQLIKIFVTSVKTANEKK
ncbi:MAG: four helix bundle protein [Planctomycetota bacterium]|nr:four helix bundle protein [Planctomycetota bacterium]